MKRHNINAGPIAAGLGAAMLIGLAGCGPVHLVASTNIPPPLVVKIPIGVALFVPKEFSQYVHREERWSTEWNVDLGKAQTQGMTRLLTDMFQRVVMVDSVAAGAQAGSDIRAILEPSVEEYAFVTPRDAGSPFFAVSIKYRVNVYMPDGKLADSWGFTGYGTSPSQGLSSTSPLAAATALAMRDAGAKLAVEFREQAIVRGLLPQTESVDAPPAPAPSAAPAELPLPNASETPGNEAGSATPSEAGTGTPANEAGTATPGNEDGTATPGNEDGIPTPGDEVSPASGNEDEAGAPTEPEAPATESEPEPKPDEPQEAPEEAMR